MHNCDNFSTEVLTINSPNNIVKFCKISPIQHTHTHTNKKKNLPAQIMECIPWWILSTILQISKSLQSVMREE